MHQTWVSDSQTPELHRKPTLQPGAVIQATSENFFQGDADLRLNVLRECTRVRAPYDTEEMRDLLHPEADPEQGQRNLGIRKPPQVFQETSLLAQFLPQKSGFGRRRPERHPEDNLLLVS